MGVDVARLMYQVDVAHDKVGEKKNQVLIVCSWCVMLGAHHMDETHHKLISQTKRKTMRVSWKCSYRVGTPSEGGQGDPPVNNSLKVLGIYIISRWMSREFPCLSNYLNTMWDHVNRGSINV